MIKSKSDLIKIVRMIARDCMTLKELQSRVFKQTGFKPHKETLRRWIQGGDNLANHNQIFDD